MSYLLPGALHQSRKPVRLSLPRFLLPRSLRGGFSWASTRAMLSYSHDRVPPYQPNGGQTRLTFRLLERKRPTAFPNSPPLFSDFSGPLAGLPNISVERFSEWHPVDDPPIRKDFSPKHSNFHHRPKCSSNQAGFVQPTHEVQTIAISFLVPHPHIRHHLEPPVSDPIHQESVYRTGSN